MTTTPTQPPSKEAAVKPWTTQEAHEVTAADEVQIRTRRPDGSLRPPRTIWIVRDGDDVFIRSTNGRGADWFRHAVATGTGQLVSRSATHDVVFIEAHDADLDRVDAAYREEYRSYASIVDHLQTPGPRAATLQVHPAQEV